MATQAPPLLQSPDTRRRGQSPITANYQQNQHDFKAPGGSLMACARAGSRRQFDSDGTTGYPRYADSDIA